MSKIVYALHEGKESYVVHDVIMPSEFINRFSLLSNEPGGCEDFSIYNFSKIV